MESKLQDSGSDYLGVRLIDLQTSQPENCTLQCESRKCITSRERRDPDCNGCICRLTFYLSHTYPPPHPAPFVFLGKLRWRRPPALGAAPARSCGVSRKWATLAVFRDLLAPNPSSGPHHTLSYQARSFGATTNFKDYPTFKWIN